ncbi:MAG: hypothetical protein J0M08_02855 [Bacteroidetes bacterium]|nr:hypothetical protein [Bacteroidota bacterium]
MNRRRFFKLGAGGAVVLMGAGSLRWFALGYSSQLTSGETPIALSTKEFVIMKSIIEALLPDTKDFPNPIKMGLPQRLDEEIWALSERLKGDLKNGLQVIEHAPLLQGYTSRFSSLSLQERVKCYEAYLTGSNDLLQQISGGLKVMVHFFYYSNSATWSAIGYEGPFISKAKPAPSRAAYASLLKKTKLA